MTPKEKARELYDKYEFVYIQNYTSKHEVKQCALIAVDEILGDMGADRGYAFWTEVKQEIEQL
jgi:hypothetical protein